MVGSRPMLANIEHIVVLMLENRSFDNMLGLLYPHKKRPAEFDGLTGHESNKDARGKVVKVAPIDATTKFAYFTPVVCPGEGFGPTNKQLFGADPPPAGSAPNCSGFVTDYVATIGTPRHQPVPGATAAETDIMQVYTPEMLPVLSTLAMQYAVCDQWFASVPTETMPNRAFALAGTSLGGMDDHAGPTPPVYATGSIFGALDKAGKTWSVYGYDQAPYTRTDFADTIQANESHYGKFADFKTAAAGGKLANFVFLEPEWKNTGNSQHPNYDVALGEQLMHDVYEVLRASPTWSSTLLVITYDEHGGCYDHVPPPGGAVPPDAHRGPTGFDFTRFGVRVPTVLVSPLIAAGTVFRVPAGGTPLDHTSILKTIEKRWGMSPLTKRDAAAPDFAAVLTLAHPRTDDALAGVKVPKSGVSPFAKKVPPSRLQQLRAQVVSKLPVPAANRAAPDLPSAETADDYDDYIERRTQEWIKAGKPKS